MSISKQLTDVERIAWLRLSRTKNVGPVAFRTLLEKYGTAVAAVEALPDLLKRTNGAQASPPYSKTAAEAEIETAAKIGACMVAIGERGYPNDLRYIHAAPPILCVSGNLDLASRSCVAVVGARNASALGLRLTRQIAAWLSAHNCIVVSGLARGIDTAAHQAAIEGGTAAVVAGGIDHFYPPENQNLQRQIGQQGLLISEMPPGMAPKAEHFPRRNRLISGMSRATVVVEAALRSGSLITARLANEQGREVFAVPGSPLDPRAQGANKLVKDGANILTAVEDLQEILDLPANTSSELFLEPEKSGQVEMVEPREQDATDVLSLISLSPTAVDDIVRESGLSPGHIKAILLELELAGAIIYLTGSTVARSPV
jgi:DNA processing protein